jgi:hypothetical protein
MSISHHFHWSLLPNPFRSLAVAPHVLAAIGLGVGLLAVTSATAAVNPEAEPESPTVQTRVLQNGTIVRKTSKFEVHITPIRDEAFSRRDTSPLDPELEGELPPMETSVCPTTVVTHSSFNFEEGGAMILQGGFVETEIAAAQHVIDSSFFPVRVDVMEKIFGTQNTTVTTTTHWSVLIWSGPPNSGTLVDVFESDDVILPHLVIPPGTHGVNIQVIVDPNDPEPIIVPANASNSVTIGFRVDQHNQPATQSCPCPTGIGTLPAVCCPPPSTLNAFPSNDTNGVSQPSRNWLWARDCPGAGGLCGVAPQGWYNFTTQGTPSGDWNIRLTYTGLNCPEGFGACCLSDGSCEILSEGNCASAGGTFQGENVSCQDVECIGVGACCIEKKGGSQCEILDISDCFNLNGTYLGDGSECSECDSLLGACCVGSGQDAECSLLSQEGCDNIDGVWQGAQTECSPGACDPPLGACCIEATGACVEFDEATCDVVDGIWQGPNTSCAGFVCFPIGACCLPDGSCAGDLSPEECDDLEGAFQGDGTTCAETNCPAPVGACCLPNGNCLELIEETCIAVAGEWQGHTTDCTDSNGDGTADDCQDDEPEPCVGDLNGDGVVNVGDLLLLFDDWGSCGNCDNCPADLNGDCVVNVGDLLILFDNWGSCS